MRFLAGVLVFLVLPAWCATSALVFHKTFGGSGNESIAAIATDPSGYVVFAGSTSSYDYPVTNGTSNTATHFAVTLDAGRTWAPLSNLPSGTPISLAVDTRTPATWYAGGTTGIFKSTDAGATWTATGSAGLSNCIFVAPFCGATALAINPAQPSIVYALTSGGIVKTADSGASWNPVAPPVKSYNPPAYLGMDPLHPDHLFTAVAGMDFRSFDGGQSWTQYTPPLLDPNSHCSSWASPIAFDTKSPNTVYLVDHCDLFRSTDGGIYWSAVSTPFTIAYAVAADPSQAGKLFVLSFDGLYGTTDGGASWNLLLPYTQGNPPPFVAFDPAQPPVVLAGAARSQDGGATWTPLALGRQPSTVVFDPRTPGRAIAATSGAPAAFVTKVDSSGTIQSSTYLGGQGGAAISGIATDPAGNIYVTGTTASRDFPVTPGAVVTAPGGTTNSFVTKFDPALKLIYSTFLPGNGQSTSIAVDRNGNAAVTGILPSASSPSACFVTKLTPDGSGVLFSERFGGSGGDSCWSVAADSTGNVIVAGTTDSRDFPLAGNGAATSFHGERDATVSKFDAFGKLVYSSYLGGTDSDSAAAIAVDGAGNIYVSGTTRSKDFPTTAGAYQTSLAAHCAYPSSSVATGFIGTITSYLMDDAFVTKLDATGNPVFSTYLGGDCYDVAGGMSVDASGNVWITGSTNSDPFPQLIPFQSGPQYAFYKSFVAELDAGGGVLRLASYIDSGNNGPAIATDVNGNAYIGGSTMQPVSPYSGPPAPPTVTAGVHALLAKVQLPFRAPLEIRSVGNAFTLRSGAVSPGQITLVTADGIAPVNPVDLTLTPAAPLPRALAGTQVLFDGEAAALISVAPGRVAAIAPYDLAGKAATAVQVVFQGAVSAPVLADVMADPGFQSADGSAAGQAYARNADGTLNSAQNPADEGSLLTLYLTGAAAIDPGCPEGGVASNAVSLQAASLTVTSVPGSVCGLFETTFRTQTYGPSAAASLPNSPLTYAVK